MKKYLLNPLYAALLFSVLVTTQVFSHSYHYELQVTNTLQTNNKKQLEALKLSFLYDGDVSNAMLQDQKDLKKLGDKLIKDLEILGYFTQVKLNEKVIKTNKASDVNLEKISIKGESGAYDTLKLNFTLVLKKPTHIFNTTTKNTEITFYHEDPTAAAILYYENAAHIVLGDALKESCKASVKEKGKFTEGEFPQIIAVTCKS